MSTFQDLGLEERLLRAVLDLGFDTPTPVQSLVIPKALEGKSDIIALAQTGTGKTAAFGLPLLHSIDLEVKTLQALIVCPTRELCMQVTNDLQNFSKYYRHCLVTAVYGGASMERQVADIKAGAQVIVATPGRLIDLMERKSLKLDSVKCVVFDEADEMLSMGFQDDIENILARAENREMTWLFSATMPDEVRRIANRYMKSPIEISAGSKNQTAANIEHIYFVCKAPQKYAVLKRVVDFHPGIFGLIFCRTKIETQEIAEQMIRDGYNSAALHGDLSQADRDKVMKRFRERNLQLLIATDVAARGIDVSDITHVINYSLPDEIEVYTHRSGRTARAGKSGTSISIITEKDRPKIKFIERLTKATFNQMMIPSGTQVCRNQLFNIIDKLHDAKVDSAAIEPFLPQIYEDLKDLSREDIIQRFASVEFNRFLKYYENAADLNPGAHGGSSNHERMFLNVGEMDGFQKKDMIHFLCDLLSINNDSLGKIELGHSYSFIEIDKGILAKAKETINGMQFKGRLLRFDEAPFNGGGSGKKERFGDKKFGDKPRFRDERGGGDRPKFGGGGGSSYNDRPKFGGGGRDRDRSEKPGKDKFPKFR